MTKAPNPLEEYPVLRQWAYRVVWFVGLVLGGVQIWFATTGTPAPDWLLPALAVLAYVSIATNYTADRNVAPTTPAETPLEARGYVEEPGRHREVGAFDNGVLIALAAIVIIVAGLIFIVRAL